MSAVALANVPTPPTRTFLDAHPGARGLIHGDHLVALYGVPLATDSDPGTTTDEFVETFLSQHADALGVTGVTLVPKDKITIRNGELAVYTYTQTIDDLPVHGSVVKICVLLGETEKIGYVGMRLAHLPEESWPVAAVSAGEAIAVVAESAKYGHLTTFSTPEMVVYEADHFDHALHRTWRFSGSDNGEAYLFFVDISSGELVGVIDRVYHADVSGRVTGYRTPGTGADNPNRPEQCPNRPYDCPSQNCAVPMAGVQVCVDTAPELCVSTDEDGYYQFTGLDEGTAVSVGARLTGEWVTVEVWPDRPNPNLVVTGTVSPPQSGVDLVFNQTDEYCQPSWPDLYDTAQMNAFLVTEDAHNWYKGLQDTFTGIDLNMPCYIGALEDCSFIAAYNPSSMTFQYSAPPEAGGCAHGAFSTIISHEYGHFIIDRTPELSDAAEGDFQEGVADTVAALMWNEPCLAKDYYGEGYCVRDVDFDAEYDNCASLPDWCDNCSSIHCRGLFLSGAFWDLQKEIGLEETSRILADFIAIAGGSLDTVLVEVLTADDDDADLSNGTPHSEDICQTFAGAHGWPPAPCVPPSADVLVGWDGPLSQNPDPPYQDWPEAGVDYVVDYDVYPPSVTLVTTEKGGDPVALWSIGRRHPGTGEPADLGTINTDWDGNGHDITVWVGVDAERPCRDLHSIDIQRQDSTHWSSVRLNLTRDLVGTADCYAASNGNGGRISGNVGRNLSGVHAKAIGIGSSDPGTLEVGEALGTTMLSTIPASSTLIVGNLGTRLTVLDLLSGTVDIRGDMRGKVSVRGIGESTGSILVKGDIEGLPDSRYAIFIDGDMSGDIVADVDGDGTGAITGEVEVGGTFNGNICGTNLGPGMPLPDNISIGTLGTNATVCDGLIPTCEAHYTGLDGGAWQNEDNWDTAPDSTKVVCIPAFKTIRIESDDPGYPTDVEAKAIHVVHTGFPSQWRAVLILENQTSLTIYEDSSIAGDLVMEHGSALYIADDLTILGNGGEIGGSYDSGTGQDPPWIADVAGGSATLTLEGVGIERDASLTVRGGLEIQVALDNNAYVVADDLEPLVLSVNPKTSTVYGHWVAEHHPVESWVGELAVDTEVSGVGTWSLVDDAAARITINAACMELGGVVKLERGILDVNANFWTSGNLLMQSVDGSAPQIVISAGRSTRFGN
jgi:hypothetical protein